MEIVRFVLVFLLVVLALVCFFVGAVGLATPSLAVPTGAVCLLLAGIESVWPYGHQPT